MSQRCGVKIGNFILHRLCLLGGIVTVFPSLLRGLFLNLTLMFTPMKAEKISESGVIGTDGKLRLPMDRLNAFFAANKGQRVIVRFEAAAPGSTAAQLAYYFQYIVPTIQTALWETGDRKTEKQVDLWLRQQCGCCYNDYGGLLEARQMTQPDFSEFLDWLKQFAAENLYVYIEDPKTI